ncbi:putative restriction endonuclease [Nocardioides daedukensis]|uniref:Putative restriction endonuclease n=1 Tax=Nocardioides daedukensis TaxID=634462 RepID=A0A7Y9S3L2_9ACTN|nr:HNH endonuclease [Nocardioides daedukensis]NYG59418.1 putative restriction endonuclease [Nocardioides daedukensis]
MTPTERLRELAIRHAAFAWLDKQRAAGKETFTQEDTSNLTLGGETFRLMPTQQGIWKPGQLRAALAIRTVYRPEGSNRPYDDAVGLDGFYRYKMRGDDPNHYQNRALHQAMAERLPLIWWLGVQGGGYSALYPIYLVAEERSDLQFVVDIDAVPQPDITWPSVDLELDPAYRQQLTKLRLHQRPFRAAVLRAYRTACAVCSFRHSELLDAAHIHEDGAGGRPVVTNGLTLCKMHHAAYDRKILGITPSYEVRINADVLQEVDGPMLRHGIQEFHGQQLMVLPERRTERPDPLLLEERFQAFLNAS